MPIRVVVIDTHSAVVNSLAALISLDSELNVVGTALSADEGLRTVLETRPHVVLLDISLPESGAFEIADELGKRPNDTNIVFLTSYLTYLDIQQALRFKARGYFMKGESFQTLVESIKAVAAGEYRFSKEVEHYLDYYGLAAIKHAVLEQHRLEPIS